MGLFDPSIEGFLWVLALSATVILIDVFFQLEVMSAIALLAVSTYFAALCDVAVKWQLLYCPDLLACDREAAICRAEGQAKALDVIAQSEKNYLATLAETIGQEEAAKILMAQKVLDGFAVISDKPGDKVFIPSPVKPFLDLGKS